MRFVRLSAGFLLLLLPKSSLAAGPQQTSPMPTRIKAFVSIVPQAYFVERIGGERVAVDVLVGPGQSPHTYEPTPKQMAGLAEARAYFRIGLAFETPLLPKIAASCPNLRIVDTRAGIPLRTMEGGRDEDDGHAHEHPAGTPDPHVWLSPRLVKIQARHICEELCRVDPAAAETFRQNLAAFEVDLDRVDAEIAAALTPLKGKTLFVYHPAYGYFTDAYGLKQVPVETGGKEPSARQVAKLIEDAKAAGVKVIFVQPQFSKKNAEAVARAIGGVVLPLDPLARNYLHNLRDIAAKIRDGLEAQKD